MWVLVLRGKTSRGRANKVVLVMELDWNWEDQAFFFFFPLEDALLRCKNFSERARFDNELHH